MVIIAAALTGIDLKNEPPRILSILSALLPPQGYMVVKNVPSPPAGGGDDFDIGPSRMRRVRAYRGR